jgi:hypothetical protein
MCDAVTAPAHPYHAWPRVHPIRRGPVYAKGRRRHIWGYAEGLYTPTVCFVGWPGSLLRRRHRHLAVGVGVGRRHLAPFLIICFSKVANLCGDLIDDEAAELASNLHDLVKTVKVPRGHKKQEFDVSNVRKSTRVKIKKPS